MAHHPDTTGEQNAEEHGLEPDTTAATTSTPCALSWASESYSLQSSSWPGRGNHLMAQFNEEAVVVYQAYKPEIAEYAVQHQRFWGCTHFKTTRMTWIKTNFLWMMFRCGWASKPGQERVLAIWLRRSAFDKYLAHALRKGSVRGFQGTVRLQWDPDHFPNGSRHPYRKAVQLGLTGVTSYMTGEDILQIDDVTAFVAEQRPLATAKKTKDLVQDHLADLVPEPVLGALAFLFIPPAPMAPITARHSMPQHASGTSASSAPDPSPQLPVKLVGYRSLMVARERVYSPSPSAGSFENLSLSTPPPSD